MARSPAVSTLPLIMAVTDRIFDRATSDLASLAQSGKPLFGIQESNAGKVVIFGGGVPSGRAPRTIEQMRDNPTKCRPVS
jgi:uncharacterized protein GlcG (DUF336 family)